MCDKIQSLGKILTSVASGGAFLIACILLLILAIAGLPFVVWMMKEKPERWEDVLRPHIQAIIGLPIAGAVAFALVVFLKQTEGAIKFSGLGFTFDGASGQVIMWVVCFLAIAGATKLLW